MCVFRLPSSDNGRFRSSPKSSTIKSRRFPRLSRDLRFEVQKFRKIQKETSILPVARIHSANGSGDEASKNFGAKVSGFPEFLFFESRVFCFWKLSVFELWKVLEAQRNTP